MRKLRKFAEGGTMTKDQQMQKYLEEKKAQQRAAAEARQKAAADKDAALAKRREGITAAERARAAEREKTSAAKETAASRRREGIIAAERARAAEREKTSAAKNAAVQKRSAQREAAAEARRKADQAKEAAKEKFVAERSAREDAAVEAKRQAGLRAEAAKEKFVAERSAKEDAAAEMKRKAGEAKEAAKAKFVAERSAKEDAAGEAKRQAGLKAEAAKLLPPKPVAPATPKPTQFSGLEGALLKNQNRRAESGMPSRAAVTPTTRLASPLGAAPAVPTASPNAPKPFGDVVKGLGTGFAPPKPAVTQPLAPKRPVTQLSTPMPTQSFGARPTPPAQPTMQQRAATSGMAPQPAAPMRGISRNDLKMAGMKKGGAVKSYAKGGKVSSASSRGDGIAQRGKTKGRIC